MTVYVSFAEIEIPPAAVTSTGGVSSGSSVISGIFRATFRQLSSITSSSVLTGILKASSRQVGVAQGVATVTSTNIAIINPSLRLFISGNKYKQFTSESRNITMVSSSRTRTFVSPARTG